jgi:hypothetical protein
MSVGDHPYADLAAMLRALDLVVAERDAAATRAVALGQVISDHMAATTRSESVSREELVALVRHLYWEYPQLTVASLAALLGVPEDGVSHIVGPVVAEERCRTCRRPFGWTKSTRHTLAPSNCPTCRPEVNSHS